VAINAEQLLVIQGSKDLAQSGLPTACFTNQENGLLILEAFVDKDCESPELSADDKFWNAEPIWHVFECLA